MTAGLWTRHEGARHYTQAHTGGQGPVLSLETACECLTADWIVADEEHGPDLEAKAECTRCEGGRLHAEHRRRAADLWRLRALDPAPTDLLEQLAHVQRFAALNITWGELPEAARGRAA